MDVKIYRPAKSTMQSGRAVRKSWVLEFETEPDGEPDMLMGWAQGGDQRSHVCLKFPTCERAITFAKKHGWEYVVFPENMRNVKPFSFADKFKYRPEE